MFDPSLIKNDFPIFQRHINGKPIVYLDSTASSLKPQVVIDANNTYYKEYPVNIFRGLYKLSEEATTAYELAREKVSQFIGSDSPNSIIFVRNATEAINLVAYSWGRINIGESDEIISTVMEHHANIVPWQQLSLESGAVIKYIDIDEDGLLNIDNLEKSITPHTKLVVLTYVSNVLGTINPVKEIVKRIKMKNSKIKVLIDAAQAVPHLSINIKDLGCDFLAFSGHKMLGPTGIGVLWAKYDLLDAMVPFQFGGEMIKEVYLDHSEFKKPPHKFEAGTPHIAGVIGLGAAVDYLSVLGMDKVRAHEKELTSYAISNLSHLSNLTIYGPKDPEKRGGVIAFNMKGLHPHDIAQILDEDNICIRSGHHCAMPLHTRLG
ncbi:SufS family cysteine desulfurase, partial [Candidatus Gottesmanbacteria bacterium]|nr:SufS family cysteine desulfurase [Candidatus Gottesmanbacteria bacterium]